MSKERESSDEKGWRTLTSSKKRTKPKLKKERKEAEGIGGRDEGGKETRRTGPEGVDRERDVAGQVDGERKI